MYALILKEVFMDAVRQIWITNKCYKNPVMYEEDFALWLVDKGIALGIVKKDVNEVGLKIVWLGFISPSKFTDDSFNEIFQAGNGYKIQKFGISRIQENYDEIINLIKEYIKENKDKILKK